MPRPQLVEEAIGGEGLRPRAGAASGTELGLVAVLIPLEEGDAWVLREEVVETSEDIRERVGIHEVEHLLRPPLPWPPSSRSRDPAGMLPHHVGVLVDHLRLDPQTEPHAVRLDPLDERPEP